jgi:hypothetical protein
MYFVDRMLAQKYMKLLRAIHASKGLVVQSGSQAALKQIVIKVKAEGGFDAFNNLVLLVSLCGKRPNIHLVNVKKGVVLPEVSLSGFVLNDFVSNTLPNLLGRTIDKITSVSYGSKSNKLSFSFKATDALHLYMRKIWKLFETEVGNYEYEITFITNNFNPVANETLIRSLQIPIVVSY